MSLDQLLEYGKIGYNGVMTFVLLCSQVLVCADGATSQLATKLGLVKDPPCSNCTRSYVKAGTHKFKADGVVFYNRDMLPGWNADVLYVWLKS